MNEIIATLRKGHVMEISTGKVAKYYRMDPYSENLLKDGSKLREGMVVLIESPEYKLDRMNSQLMPGGDDSLMHNRWCMVTELEIVGETVSFVGVYGDRTKRRIDISIHAAWYVKTDSLNVESLEAEKYAEIRKVVTDIVADSRKTAFGFPRQDETMIDNFVDMVLNVIKK